MSENWTRKPKRTKILFSVCRLLAPGFRMQYDLQDLSELEKLVVFPNHQKGLLDVPVTAVAIEKSTGRIPYFVTKSSVPDNVRIFFEKCGAVPITRGRDLYKMPRKQRKEALEKARERAEEVYTGILPSILESHDPIVIYPEATIGGKIPPPTRNICESLIKIDKGDINYVNMRIDYRLQILVSMGEPYRIENLEEKIKEVTS